MKKQLLGLMTILTILNACQKNEVSVSLPEEVTIHATIEDKDATKTIMDESNNILWSENDQIIAFMKSSYGHKYQVKPSFIGKSYADFSMVSSNNGSDLSAGNEWEHNVVYYPYSEDIECLKSGANYALEVNLPAEQTYVPDSFANGSMAMVAVSENNNITFKNVLGAIKLQLKGTQKVASIKIEGKNNEKLAGAATVTAYTDENKPAITMASGASKTITLNCGSGVHLNESTATEFIVALPPVLFSKGFTMTVIDDAGNEQTIQTDKENSVLRSSLLVMPEVTLDKVPQTGDYIDEYGINHGPGVKIGETVWAPVNCGYKAASETDNGYQYGKLYQWGRKYGQGYDGCLWINGEADDWHSDATFPQFQEGSVSAESGSNIDNAEIFFTATDETDYDWCEKPDEKLWNSGWPSTPEKTEYDPCPEGWRVPTYWELEGLLSVESTWTYDASGQSGLWFGETASDADNAAKVFFPAAGYCGYDMGSRNTRGYEGHYWSCTRNGDVSNDLYFTEEYLDMSGGQCANGYSVRCVQE